MFSVRFKKCLVLAAVVAVVSLASVASANVVTNGSFESGMAGWTLSGDGGATGWPPTQGYPQECDNGNPGSNFMGYIVNLHGATAKSSLSQTISLVGGVDYRIFFRYNSINAWTSNSQIAVKLGDTDLYWDFFPPADGNWTYNKPFYTSDSPFWAGAGVGEKHFTVAASGDYVLSFIQNGFVDTNLDTRYATRTMITGISVTPPVPEPGSLMALIAGLGGLVGFAGRRKA
jgi:hypothetical protein